MRRPSTSAYRRCWPLLLGPHDGHRVRRGDGVSHKISIYDDCSPPHAIMWPSLTAWLHLCDVPQREIVPDVKDTLASVTLDFEEEELERDTATANCQISCSLPNGKEIVIANERFRCPFPSRRSS
jgi:hypothetical protein